jgi:hypothetical protein
VGGTVTGLTGTLVLQNNLAGNLTVIANGSFTFATGLKTGATYSVTVSSTNPAQTCTVVDGAGTVTGANVTSVVVTCSIASYALGGTVTGLGASGVVLHTNVGENKAVTANGGFTFDTSVAGGTAYTVSVQSQPSAPAPRYCTITNGNGTVTGQNVSDIQVNCVQLTIGGTVKYLNGSGLELQNNGESLSVTANGDFTFPTAMDNGATYNVTVPTQPSGPTQTCAVANGSGTVSGASITNVEITCGPWTKQFGAEGIDEIRAVATDSGGNIIVAGYVGGAADYQMVVVKYAVNGTQMWRQELGVATVQDHVYGVATDGAGDVYLAGYSNGGLDGTNAGGQDLVVVKYDALGQHQWTRQLGTSANDAAYGIAVGASALYVVGSTGGALDGNTHAGGDDLFVVKYTLDGTKQWTRQLGTGVNDVAYAVAADSSGVYVTGSTGGDLDGNTSAGDDDLFLVKYDSDGVKQWTRQLGTGVADIGRGAAMAAGGGVYVAGHTYGGLIGTNAGEADLILLKYAADGAQLLANQYGTIASDFAYAIATDSSGVYLAGVRGELGDESLLAKYDLNGLPQWTQLLGTTGTDYAYGVATDGSGSIYVGGYTTGGLDGYVNSGGHDAFVAKYNSNGVKQ